MKIVLNKPFGGFGLSVAGLEYYYRLKGIQEFFYYISFRDRATNEKYYKKPSTDNELLDAYVFTKDFGPDGIIDISSEDFEKYFLADFDIERTDKDLVKTVRDLGEAANGAHSDLVIVEIPDDVKWQIEEYDGMEWVAEVHRTWG